MINGMITGRWREARQLLLWLTTIVRVLHLLHSKLLRMAVQPLMLVDSIGLSVSVLPWSLLWWSWVGVAVVLARGQLLGNCRRRVGRSHLVMDAVRRGVARSLLMMDAIRRGVARPLLVMDAVRRGRVHHLLLLQRLVVVRSLMLLWLLNNLRLEVAHLRLVLRLRLILSLKHQLLLVLLPLLHYRDRGRENLPKLEW